MRKLLLDVDKQQQQQQLPVHTHIGLLAPKFSMTQYFRQINMHSAQGEDCMGKIFRTRFGAQRLSAVC